MQKKSYHPPELTELGYLRNLVEQGIPKTAGGNDGGSPEADKPNANTSADDQFTRGSKSSSDSSGGRSGRN